MSHTLTGTAFIVLSIARRAFMKCKKYSGDINELLILSVAIRKALQKSLLGGNDSILFTTVSSVVDRIMSPKRCPHPEGPCYITW
jgi:hypothetical protein